MKKILSVIAALCIMLSFAIPASAAGISVSLSGSTTVTADGSVTYTVNLSGAQKCTGGSVAITVGDKLEVTSGEFLKDGSILANFDLAKNKGAIAFKDKVDLNGGFFRFTVKAKEAAKDGQAVSVTVTLADGTSDSGSSTLKIICANHSYGSWAKVNDGSHKRTCSACGHEETGSHTWNGGTVTKPATCKEAGNRKYTCTACGAEKNETIPKGTTHSWGSFKVTKQPTCTAPGTQTRTCSVCGATDTATVNATGHSMGSWTTTKAPTCTAAGEQTRSCSKCSHKETKTVNALGHSFSSPTVTKQPTCTSAGEETGKCTRCGATTSQSIAPTGHSFGAWYDDTAATCTEGGIMKRVCTKCNAVETRSTDALGHDFENPTIVKEATISEPGLKEGKCRRCGETTSEVIPCSAKDPATGTEFSADEGVFSAGTELKVEETAKDDPTFESVKNILKDVSGEFKLYDVSATLNGSDVQPNGKVKVKFAVPEGYGSNISVNVINADGTYRTVDSILSEDGSFITAELDALGSIAICKLGASAGNDGSSDSSTNQPAGTSSQPDSKVKSGSHTWLIVLIVIVVVAAAGVGIFFVMKKKKA